MSLTHVLIVVLLVSIVALVDAVVGQVHVAIAQSLCGVRVSEAGLHQLQTTKQFLNAHFGVTIPCFCTEPDYSYCLFCCHSQSKCLFSFASKNCNILSTKLLHADIFHRRQTQTALDVRQLGRVLMKVDAVVFYIDFYTKLPP